MTNMVVTVPTVAWTTMTVSDMTDFSTALCVSKIINFTLSHTDEISTAMGWRSDIDRQPFCMVSLWG